MMTRFRHSLLIAAIAVVVAQGGNLLLAHADAPDPRTTNYLGRVLALAEGSRNSGPVSFARQMDPYFSSSGLMLDVWEVTDRAGTFDVMIAQAPTGAPILAYGSVANGIVKATAWLLSSRDATAPVAVQRYSEGLPPLGPNGVNGDLICATVTGIIFNLLPITCGAGGPIGIVVCKVIVGAGTGAAGYEVCSGSNVTTSPNMGWYGYPRGGAAPPTVYNLCHSCSPQDWFLVADIDLYATPPCMSTASLPTSNTCYMEELNSSCSCLYPGVANVFWDYRIAWPDGSEEGNNFTDQNTDDGGRQSYHDIVSGTIPPGSYEVAANLFRITLNPADGNYTIPSPAPNIHPWDGGTETNPTVLGP